MLLLVLFIKKVPASIIIMIIVGYALSLIFGYTYSQKLITIPTHFFTIPDF